MADRNALNLRWTFGFNMDSEAGTLVDLTADGRRAVFFAVGHTGVIFDYEVRQQRLLQGHTNTISCAAASDDKKWLTTGDIGEKDTMIVVWNARTGVPVRTIFDAHPGGIICLDMTPDAMYIAALGAGPVQNLSVWEWTVQKDDPVASSEITTRDLQHCVRFRRDEKAELVTNGVNRTIFWNWEASGLKYYSPAISSKEFLTPIGRFTQSVFIPNSTQAVTATEDGDLLLWDHVLLPALHARPTDRCAVKLLRLHDGNAITVVQVFDNFLVTAATDGFVRFYDFKFRLLAWYEDLDVGPITALTFTSPRSIAKDGSQLDAKVRVPNFVIASKSGKIALVNAAVFDYFTKEERRGELLVQAFESAIAAICAHPLTSQFFVVTTGGMLRVVDYESQTWLRHKVLEKRTPTCMCINPNGQELVVGCTDGTLLILSSIDLELLQRSSQVEAPATSVEFSPEGTHIAMADGQNCVGIYRRERNVLESGKEVPWLYLGRYRSHHGPIVGLKFVDDKDAGAIRLLSLGRDRVLVEYDLSNSFAATGVVVRSALTVEQTAIPTSLLVLPPATQPGEDPLRTLLVSANNEFKFKVLDVLGLVGVHHDSDDPLPSQESHCVQTLLGPTYGPPPNALLVLPDEDKGSRYAVYGTPEKVVGLVKLPLDGNPNCGMGLIAHPGAVRGVCISYDGKFVLTTGGADYSVLLWEIDTGALDASAAMGGTNIEPYEALIPGGKEGEFYDEMCNYFYLAQLRAQGEDTTEEREITGQVPIDAVPDIFRALGYYPSQFEVRDLQHEVKRKGKDTITLTDLIRLYVNHKPVADVSLEHMADAFAALGAEPISGLLKADALFMMLKRIGEPLSDQELQQCIHVASPLSAMRSPALIGQKMSGREDLSAAIFSEQILGFEAPEGGEESGEVQVAEALSPMEASAVGSDQSPAH